MFVLRRASPRPFSTHGRCTPCASSSSGFLSPSSGPQDATREPAKMAEPYHDDVPTTAGLHEPLMPPDTRRLGEASPSLRDSVRDSYVGTAPTSPDPQAERPFITPGASEEKIVGGGIANRQTRRRRWPFFALAGLIAAVVIALAVALPVSLC